MLRIFRASNGKSIVLDPESIMCMHDNEHDTCTIILKNDTRVIVASSTALIYQVLVKQELTVKRAEEIEN